MTARINFPGFTCIQIISLLLSGLSIPLADAAPVKPVYIPSKYIVVFNPGVAVDATVADLTGRFSLSVSHRYRHALLGMAITIPPALLPRLAADPRVKYVEQDVVVSAAAQILPSGVDRVNADLNPAAKIDGIDILADRVDADIAILDTGIDLDHPDLNVFNYANCRLQGRYKCFDGDTAANDVNGHGTHVAGIAAAIDNASGVVGVAPGARLWAVKVLDDQGNGVGAQIIAGMDYVVAHASEIEVANMSLTGTGSFQALDDAITNAVSAGITVVLAAGNDDTDVLNVFPAGHPAAITVSALTDYDGQPGGLAGGADDKFAGFSNYGSGVDIMAPGVSIRSTVVGGGTGFNSGTSMAAPHVAGAAALYLAHNPGASPQAVKNELLTTADPAPCVTGPLCPGDPDGIPEPLLMYPALANGDLNDDGVVDVRDILLGQRIVMGQVIPTAAELERGDVAPLINGLPASDGIFNVADLLLIIRIVTGDLVI
jgi:subtilisin family serine protease